jgi:hypothetical protein
MDLNIDKTKIVRGTPSQKIETGCMWYGWIELALDMYSYL